MSLDKAGWKQFLTICHHAKDDKTLSAAFDLLLTSEERESISTRCLIIKELLKGELTQREIAKKLHVSIAKITRGSNEIKRMPGDFVKNLGKLLK